MDNHYFEGGVNMVNEFKKFIMRGNVLDLAIGVIIGTAFGAIVNSLVNNIIMPPIGVIIGGIDFSQIKIVLKAASGDTPEAAIGVGVFLNAVISFLIIAFVVFLIVRAVNKFMPPPPPPPPPGPTPEEKLTDAIERLIKVMDKQS
jgi:large conductance mechanosensitive channel